MSDDRDFTRAGEVLKTLFDRIIPDQPEGYTGLFSGWEKIAGSRLAMHVRPKDIINHSLVLETDHPGWSQEIRMRQEGILRELQSRYPDLEIRKIRVIISDKKKESNNLKKAEENQTKISLGNRVSSDSADEGIGREVRPETLDKTHEDKDFFELLDAMRRRGNP